MRAGGGILRGMGSRKGEISSEISGELCPHSGESEVAANQSRTENRGSYSLRLANGLTWSLVPTVASAAWVMKLGRIMGLKTSIPDSRPRIIFCRGEFRIRRNKISVNGLPPEILKNIPESGWKVIREMGIDNWYHPDIDDVIVDMGNEGDDILDGVPMGQALTPIFNRVIAHGGLPLHAALAEYRGLGCLLAAPGGGGKSTCARRLFMPWRTLSDDAALIVQVKGNGYRAHPLPTWSEFLHKRSENTWNAEEHLPCSAVFFLEQATCDNTVPVGQAKSAVSLYHAAAQVCGMPPLSSCSREHEREIHARIFENACEIARSVPCYLLRVSLTGRFWEEMERVL